MPTEFKQKGTDHDIIEIGKAYDIKTIASEDLDENKHVAAILMVLLKTLDYLPQGLLFRELSP